MLVKTHIICWEIKVSKNSLLLLKVIKNTWMVSSLLHSPPTKLNKYKLEEEYKLEQTSSSDFPFPPNPRAMLH